MTMTMTQTQTQSHILVVDDDDRIRALVRRFLLKEGYRVSVAANADAARRLFGTLDFDLVVLDIMMPGEDGISLLSWLRRGRNTPVILLTARAQSSDRIGGLKAGADDYLPKPFEPEELALRIAAILRRTPAPREQADIMLSGRRFDPERLELSDGQARVRLTEAEAQLLSILAARGGEAVSRYELSELTSAGAERSVDVQVTRLRRKIEADPREPQHLQTVRGVGYRLVVDASPR